MTVEQGGPGIRALKKCPYCGEEVTARGLYLHVRNSEGGGHGSAGTVPRSFNVDDVPISRYAHEDDESDFENKSLRCKHCSQVFSNLTDAMLHLEQAQGKGEHPKTLKPQNTLLVVPQQVTQAPPKFHEHSDSPIGRYRQQYEAEIYVEEPQVPLSELEDLLDEYRMNEVKGSAWVKAAEKLNELLEQYRL